MKVVYRAFQDDDDFYCPITEVGLFDNLKDAKEAATKNSEYAMYVAVDVMVLSNGEYKKKRRHVLDYTAGNHVWETESFPIKEGCFNDRKDN